MKHIQMHDISYTTNWVTDFKFFMYYLKEIIVSSSKYDKIDLTKLINNVFN